MGVAFDASGNLYIADNGNHRIRKVTPSGIITTVAGGGTGVPGDGGPATAASLRVPSGVAVDALGNLYIADSGYSRIRKVTPGGIITTVAGGGTEGFAGDGGPATAASIATSGVAVDALGNLYIADSVYSRIIKLIMSASTAGCIYSIDAGSQSYSVTGGRGTVGVLVNKPECPWLSGSYVDWISVTSGTTTIGNGIVSYSVAPNRNSASRTGTLWIAGKTFTVTQRGLTCSYSINPDTVSIPAGGVIGSAVNVSTNAPDCRWSASSVPSWILVSAGNSGIGNGTLTYTVGINTGAFRTGTITIAGQTFTVYQAPHGGAAPVISSEGVLNAASGIAGALAPGGFVTIYGEGLGPAQPVASKSMERALGYTRVFFNGIEAFLTYASAGQVNALVPYGIFVNGEAGLQVEYQMMKSNSILLPVAQAAPGIFTQQYGAGQAWLVNEDRTFNSDKNPAERGSYIAFWATGQGLVDPAGKDGEVLVAPNFPRPRLPVKVTIGGLDAEVVFAGLVYTGVLQVNARVPEATAPGSAAELLLTVGDFSSRNGVTLAVR